MAGVKNGIKYLWTDKKRTFLGLPLSFTRYFITDTQFITRTGFLNVQEDEIELYRITDKKMEFPLSQRLFGCGTIIIYSKDVDTPTKEVHAIKNARQVSELLTACVNEMRDKYNVRGRDMIGDHEPRPDGSDPHDFPPPPDADFDMDNIDQ